VLAGGQAEFFGFQAADFVAQASGFLELQVRRRVAHLLFEFLDIGAQIVADHVGAVVGDRHGDAILGRDMGDDVADIALDRRGGDAVFAVIRFLLFAAAAGFVERPLHAAGNTIGIENDAPVDIASGAADGLDERGFGTQKPLLIRVEDRNQSAFGDVQPFPQQVDADQHIVNAHAQVADQLDPLQRFGVRMHVADLDPRFVHIFGQIFRHPLGQRGDERAIAEFGGLAAFDDQVLHLFLDRLDLDRRVDQAGGADDLFAEHAAGLLHLPPARRRGDADGLGTHRIPFVEAQRAVVDRRRQAESIFGQRDLTLVIAPRHAVDLADRLMALIDEQQGVFRQIFEQGRRRFARQATGEEAGVILDPRATAGGGDHLQVEIGPLFQPLVLQQLALRLQLFQPFGKFVADRFHRLFQRRARGDVVRIRIDADIIEVRDLLPGQGIELGNLLDIVAKEADPPGGVLIMRWEDFEAVATHPEIAALKRRVVALILQGDELADDLPLVDHLPFLQVEDHRRIGFDRPDAIEAGHRRHDDDVVALQQRPGGRVAHPVDRLVHRAFLLDVRVGPGDIGFGLVIVVIADEIFDRIVGEEVLELAIKLRGEDLVGGKDQRGALQMVDDARHREGLAGAGDAEQNLIPLPRPCRRDQFLNRRRLIPGGFVIADELERTPALRLVGALRAVGDEAGAGFGLGKAGADLDRHDGNMVPLERGAIGGA